MRAAVRSEFNMLRAVQCCSTCCVSRPSTDGLASDGQAALSWSAAWSTTASGSTAALPGRCAPYWCAAVVSITP